MESFAQAFDQPVDSLEHINLMKEIVIAGSDYELRYWFRRVQQYNFFRKDEEFLIATLQQYMISNGYIKGAKLIQDYQCWPALVILFRHQVEIQAGYHLTNSNKLVTAIQAVLFNPELTNAALAVIAKTTEKQIARMSDVFLIQKCWRNT
jgi:hypothetical protein